MPQLKTAFTSRSCVPATLSPRPSGEEQVPEAVKRLSGLCRAFAGMGKETFSAEEVNLLLQRPSGGKFRRHIFTYDHADASFGDLFGDGVQRVPVTGDGACQYRSLAEVLYGSETHYRNILKLVAT